MLTHSRNEILDKQMKLSLAIDPIYLNDNEIGFDDMECQATGRPNFISADIVPGMTAITCCIRWYEKRE